MQLCALRWCFFTKSLNEQSLITKIGFGDSKFYVVNSSETILNRVTFNLDPGIWMNPWDWGGPYIPMGGYRALCILMTHFPYERQGTSFACFFLTPSYFYMIGSCFWCPSCPGACGFVSLDGFYDRTVKQIFVSGFVSTLDSLF